MRVITFSRTFFVKHPRKGEETFFVEKIWKGLKTGNHRDGEYTILSKHQRLMKDGHWQLPHLWRDKMCDDSFHAKHHTIRAGNRWKVGDFFSPRIWSGKPYASKQIQFAPPIEIKKIWHISFDNFSVPAINGVHLFDEYNSQNWDFNLLARNDGLSPSDMIAWFKPYKETVGQILCWNEKIKY